MLRDLHFDRRDEGLILLNHSGQGLLLLLGVGREPGTQSLDLRELKPIVRFDQSAQCRLVQVGTEPMDDPIKRCGVADIGEWSGERRERLVAVIDDVSRLGPRNRWTGFDHAESVGSAVRNLGHSQREPRTHHRSTRARARTTRPEAKRRRGTRPSGKAWRRGGTTASGKAGRTTRTHGQAGQWSSRRARWRRPARTANPRRHLRPWLAHLRRQTRQ